MTIAEWPEALIEWPESLPSPLYPHDQEYVSGLESPEEILWPYRTRKRPDLEDSVEFVFTAAQMLTFRTFFHDTLNNGSNPFSADWLTLLDEDTGFARFGGAYQATLLGYHWRVTARLELIAVE